MKIVERAFNYPELITRVVSQIDENIMNNKAALKREINWMCYMKSKSDDEISSYFPEHRETAYSTRDQSHEECVAFNLIFIAQRSAQC